MRSAPMPRGATSTRQLDLLFGLFLGLTRSAPLHDLGLIVDVHYSGDPPCIVAGSMLDPLAGNFPSEIDRPGLDADINVGIEGDQRIGVHGIVYHLFDLGVSRETAVIGWRISRGGRRIRTCSPSWLSIALPAGTSAPGRASAHRSALPGWTCRSLPLLPGASLPCGRRTSASRTYSITVRHVAHLHVAQSEICNSNVRIPKTRRFRTWVCGVLDGFQLLSRLALIRQLRLSLTSYNRWALLHRCRLRRLSNGLRGG